MRLDLQLPAPFFPCLRDAWHVESRKADPDQQQKEVAEESPRLGSFAALIRPAAFVVVMMMVLGVVMMMVLVAVAVVV